MPDYTDSQRQQIADDEYKTYQLGKPVYIGTGKDQTTVGYVAQVIQGPGGLNGYVLTDKRNENPLTAQHVTILYQGTQLNPVDLGDLGSDAQLGAGVATGGGGWSVPTQYTSAAQSLQDVAKRYPKAHIDVYGHSLGSSDAQYALADLDPKDAGRTSAWLYEGPNVYTQLDDRQKRNADRLTKSGRIRNYTDDKDLIPLGYGPGKKTVGQWERVRSKKADNFKNQHMWGGYQFGKGGKLELYTNVSDSLDSLDKKKKALAKANGGKVSKAEQIWLESQEAGVIATYMQQRAGQDLADFKRLMQQYKDKADEEWEGTLSDARTIGDGLSEQEIRDALEAGGATKKTIADDVKDHFDSLYGSFGKVASDFDDLAGRIDNAIDKQVSTDQELAQQLGAL